MIWGVTTITEYAGILITGICLGIAVWMDIRWQEVYDFIWLIMLAAGGIMYFSGNSRMSFSLTVVISLSIYFLFQEIVMTHFYGKADCHAFCACSLVYASFGCELEYYALHMAVSWIMLSVVQLIRKNVTRCGKLRKPVPMIPYITAGFFLVLFIP